MDSLQPRGEANMERERREPDNVQNVDSGEPQCKCTGVRSYPSIDCPIHGPEVIRTESGHLVCNCKDCR